MVLTLDAVLLLGALAAALGSVSGSMMCKGSGGVCTTKARGCKKGRFAEGMCGGSYYYYCCIPDPVQDKKKPKPTQPAPFRQCYDCMYSVNLGKKRKGVVECLDGPNLHLAQYGVKTVNCSGQCSKELFRINPGSYVLTRKCHLDCHSYQASRDHSVLCCANELCNSSDELRGTSICLLIALYIAEIVRQGPYLLS